MSELSTVVTKEIFKNAYQAFMKQAEKNVVTGKSNGSKTPDGFSKGTKLDGETFTAHFGQGHASKTPYLNWWVASVYYLPENGKIFLGIEEDRYPFIKDIALKPVGSNRIGNKNKNVVVYDTATRDTVDFSKLYDSFIRLCDEILRLGVVDKEYPYRIVD